MQKFISSIFFSIVVGVACAQTLDSSDIPSSIKTRFTADFISAKNIEWQYLDGSHYAVKFFHQSQHKKVYYNLTDSTSILETILTSPTQLPTPTIASIKKIEKQYIVDEITMIEDQLTTVYKFLIRKDDAQYLLTLDANGRRVRKERIKG
jgi:hypothetical protein